MEDRAIDMIFEKLRKQLKSVPHKFGEENVFVNLQITIEKKTPEVITNVEQRYPDEDGFGEYND